MISGDGGNSGLFGEGERRPIFHRPLDDFEVELAEIGFPEIPDHGYHAILPAGALNLAQAPSEFRHTNQAVKHDFDLRIFSINLGVAAHGDAFTC